MMDSKEFVRKFEEKVKLAKEGTEDEKKKIESLKEKLILNIQENFIDSIPEELSEDSKHWIYSEYIRFRYQNGKYVNADVRFKDFTHLEQFMSDIAQYLSEILHRKVEFYVYKHEFGYDYRFCTCC